MADRADLPLDAIEALRHGAHERRSAHHRAAIVPVRVGAGPETLAHIRSTVAGAFPRDTLVTLHLPTLLADRFSISRGALHAMLLAPGGEGWVRALREAMPRHSGRALSWVLHHTDLTDRAARRLVDAMESGDFGAVLTLVAREDPTPELVEGEFHMPRPAPLAEVDARALLTLLLRRFLTHPCWFLLSGLEELILAPSPLAPAFTTGLRAWLEVVLRLTDVPLVMSCWRPALGSLGAVDPALAALRRGAMPSEPSPRPPTPEAVAAGIARRFALQPPQRWEQRACWTMLGQGRGAMLLWPQDTRDPAARLAAVAGEAAELIRGCPVAVVVPTWALGQGHEVSRLALLRAFPALRWVPFDADEQALLASPVEADDPGLASFRARLNDAWAAR